ncbi:ParA family protein [uncultured Chryseobacterium sp.]|uniref:ParA family protein n=1 Tax=uncultured Chryseobacterium sp. TaxID=259322 RepID=UPI0025E11659|nr:ParA family protein [uncultured Chryseobacterium sp.]
MASAKGGSGKTILTATFGAFLSAIGKKVLIVDVDASTNGLTLLYLKEIMLQNEHAISEGRTASGTYEYQNLSEKLEIVNISTGVYLIPATYSFLNTENVSLERFKSCLRYIKGISSEYDYVFLDAQAGSDSFAHEAMSKNISNEVIIVSEYDPLSAAGVERLKALFREDLTYNRTWVLLNKMLPDFVKSFSDFLEVAKYLSPIPWDADVVKAYSRRKLAIDLEAGNEFTLAVMQTLKSLFNEELSEDFSSWILEKALPLKEPLQIQYDDTLKKLEIMFEIRNNLQKESFFQSIFSKIKPFAIIIPILLSTIIIIINTKLDLNKLKNLSNSDLIQYSLLILCPIAIFSIIEVILKSNKKPHADIEEYRIRREINSLEEKLKKLESLIELSPEDLIKSKSR